MCNIYVCSVFGILRLMFCIETLTTKASEESGLRNLEHDENILRGQIYSYTSILIEYIGTKVKCLELTF